MCPLALGQSARPSVGPSASPCAVPSGDPRISVTTRLKRTTRIPIERSITVPRNTLLPSKTKSEQRWTIQSLARVCGALLRIILHLVVSFSSTKPNGPDSHTKSRPVQSLPSQTLLGKRFHKTMLLLIEEIQFPRHRSSDQATAFNDQKNGESYAKVHRNPYYVRPGLQQEAVRDYSLGQRTTYPDHGNHYGCSDPICSIHSRPRSSWLQTSTSYQKVDSINTTKTNIGRDAPRRFDEMPRHLLALSIPFY